MGLASASFDLKRPSVKVLGLENEGTLYAELAISCPRFLCWGTATLSASIATVKTGEDGRLAADYYFRAYWSGASPFSLLSCDRCGVAFRPIEKCKAEITDCAEDYLEVKAREIRGAA